MTPSPRLRPWPASRYPAAMVDDIDIYRSARLLIDQDGDEAAIRAAERADAMREHGDMDGVAVWLRVLDAIRELQDEKPAGTMH